jgi:regulator of sigma E protease
MFALISLLAVVVVLGVMIVVHEFGHFAVAKLCGVRVEVFSVGFGKRLFGIRRGETDYRVSLLPLGGYVKMAGENPMEERKGDPREFLSRPRWQRFLIAVAGPAMNLVLAVGLLTGVYMVRYEIPAYLQGPAVIGWVDQGTPVASAKLQSGDRIVRLDGVPNPTWQDVELKVLINPSQAIPITVQRGAETISTTVVPETVGVDRTGGNMGWYPARPVEVAVIDPNLPGAKAGLQLGDQITRLNEAGMHCVEELLAYLAANKDKPVQVAVLRDGKTLDFTVTPVLSMVDGEPRYRLGFQSREKMTVEKLPFLAALTQSLVENKRYSSLFVEVVQKVVQRKVSVRQFEGPIGIAAASGEAAMQPGWIPLLSLTALISLQLGILNLLPIPILDGGMILLLLIEGTIRRDISMRIKERIYQLAFVFLVLFVGLVIYNDLVKNVPGLAKYLP